MRSFLDWLKESAANQKPILFVGDNSSIIPPDSQSPLGDWESGGDIKT